MALLRRKYILLGLITLLAFFLRFNQVTSNPPALNWDEVSIGYNSYSILKTGRDEWNQPWPVHFKAFGEYKLPVQIYASIPGIAVFGLNELGMRITPVVYGTATVVLLYFLAIELFEVEAVGLIAAFLLAISPWHIQLTRASFESSFSVFWVFLGLLLVLRSLSAKNFKFKISNLKLWYLIGGALAFAVSIYTYNSARVFAPLFLVFLFWYFRKWLLANKKTVAIASIVFLITMIPLVHFIVQTGGNSRYKLVSITDDPGLIPRLDQARNTSTLPHSLNVLINNRYTYVSFYFAENYLEHFSPQFLFLTGAPHHQQAVQNQGELYLFQLPLVLAGLYFMYKKKLKYGWLVIAWILIAIIPVSTTNDTIPNALRTVIANPMYQIISALGAYFGYLLIKQKYRKWIPTLIFISAFVVTISIGLYLYNFYMVYPIKYSRDWQYGYKQAVEYVQAHQAAYDKVVFSRSYGEPHIFMLFFTQFDPAKFQNDPTLNRYEDHQWIWVEHFDKYDFPDLGDKGTHFEDIVKSNPGKKILFVGKPGDFPPGTPILDQVNFLDGTGAFEIVQN
jgi:4-amino-4-deoxy-L-arabinose transferase-like glycosyltransferase